MEIQLPIAPVGVLTLLAFLAPFAVALINRSWWSPKVKRWVAVIVPILLGLIVLAYYYVLTGEVLPAWPVLLLLAIVVCQASYQLVTKSLAKALESATSGRHSA